MSIRSLLSIACGALFLNASTAQDRPVTQLAPGVFFWQGDRDQRQPANCVWIQFKDHVLVVDANFPWAAKQIASQIKSTTHGPVRYVFDTHWHNDHTFGNCIYTDSGAVVVSTRECADELASRGPASWNGWNDSAHPLKEYHLEQPAISFSDRMIFDDGTERVELVRVLPSHSKGDAVAYLPGHKILITGDLVVNWGFGNNNGDTGGNPENWIQVLDELLTWDVKTVVPGHGPPVDLAKMRAQRDYLQDILGQVKDGIRAGKTADELARVIDLAKHGSFGMNPGANAASIRAMSRFLTTSRK
jgi:cyclase